MIVSIYPNAFETTPKTIGYRKILEGIKSGKWQKKVEELRSILHNHGKEAYNSNKTSMPCCSFAGSFSRRSNGGLHEYSGLILIDVDNILDFNELLSRKSAICQDKMVHSVFLSPSNQGMKILFRSDNKDPEKHIYYFLQAQKHIEETYKLAIDKSGKDPARLCFFSYDPDLYLNEESVLLTCPPEMMVEQRRQFVPSQKLSNSTLMINPETALSICVKWAENQGEYTDGQRNRFLHYVSCAMNRVGVYQDDTEHLLVTNFDLPEKEIKHLVKMAYFHNKQEFGTYELKEGDKQSLPDATDLGEGESAITAGIIASVSHIMNGTLNPKILSHIAGYYIDGMIHNDVMFIPPWDRGKYLSGIMDKIRNSVSEKVQETAMDFEDVSAMAGNFADNYRETGTMGLGLSFFDNVDVIIPGNLIGLVGEPQTFKSVLVSHISRYNAANGTGVLYLSGEMGRAQLFNLICKAELSHDWKRPENKEKIKDKGFVKKIGDQVNEILGNNFYSVIQKGFTRQSIKSTVQAIEIKSGKKIGIIIIDGLTEWDWGGKEEIPAAIANSMDAKELAKETDACVIALLHTSGRNEKHFRHTISKVRGGIKIEGQMDGTLMTSLIVHPDTELMDNEDVLYYRDKFYLRYNDKRGGGGVTNAIISVSPDLCLMGLTDEVNKYEFKTTKNGRN